MAELQEIINSKLDAAVDSGLIEKVIEENVRDLVKISVSEAMKSYGNVAKLLKERVTESMKVAIEEMTLAEHNKEMVALFTHAVDEYLISDTKEKLKVTINEIFERPPESITLSEFIEKYKKDIREDSGANSNDSIGLLIDPSEYNKGAVTLELGDGPINKSTYSNSRHLKSDAVHLYLFKADEEDAYVIRIVHNIDGHRGRDNFPCLRGVYRLVYQMYCAGTKLVFDQGLDADDYDTSMEEYY